MNSKGIITRFALICIAIFGACPQGWGSGFGLYEASAKSYALGGVVIGKAVDASANFHNPATLTDLTNITLTVGAVTEHPRCRIKVDGATSENMDPGVFALPHFMLAMPLPANFTFGLGVMPEYGLGSAYDDNWTMNYNSTETTVMSFTVNPNLAWKWGDFSVGAGLRFLFFDFEQYQYPYAGMPGSTMHFGRMNSRLKGDNGMRDFGYQVGLKYDITERFSIGAVYKSATMVHVKGKSEVSARESYMGDTGAAVVAGNVRTVDGPAETEMELPQSIIGGFNWDINDDFHLGGAVCWTQWSSIGTLDFNLNGYHKPIKLEWNDTWRVGIAPRWDFADGWSAMASYVYENDCCGDQESTMLPAADRHMLAWGLSWSPYDWMEIAFTYGIIIMDGKETQCRDTVSNELHHYRAYRGLSHAAGLSLTFRF